MKIVLAAQNGSWGHTNLAIRCLRPRLEQTGFTVILKEYTLRDRMTHILEDLVGEQADIYGFSCYIWNIESILSLSNSLHKILPHAKIVLGGPEVSFDTARFETLDHIDAIICGEGEEAFKDLCLKIQSGKGFPRIIHANEAKEMPRDGILYRAGEKTGDILYYESSRGCPYRCAYCLSSANGHLKFKTVDETLSDLLEFEKCAIDCKVIKFVDRTFNADIHRANQIWEGLLSDTFTKRYHFEICASLLNEESFAILSRFPKGKIQLEIGLQSTHLPTLAAAARHISPDAVINAVKRIFDFGNIHVHLDLIAGLPYESYERFSQSFDDAYGCCHMLQLGFLKLLHGTPMREMADEYGYKFLSAPPYTVLENPWISYAQLQKLSHIAELLERYFESGRFIHTLWYLTPVMDSPFRFWEGLWNEIHALDKRHLQQISQLDAFRYLLHYALKYYPVNEASLKEALCADFMQGENKNPPAFLRQ